MNLSEIYKDEVTYLYNRCFEFGEVQVVSKEIFLEDLNEYCPCLCKRFGRNQVVTAVTTILIMEGYEVKFERRTFMGRQQQAVSVRYIEPPSDSDKPKFKTRSFSDFNF